MSEQNPAPEELQASEQGQAPGAGYERESFGSWLRSQREVRRVDLETIAQSSKINIRYLELLEEDRFDLLPASIFVRGFLREYARIVGLDPDEVLNFYLVASAGGEYDRSTEAAGSSASTWQVGRTVAVLVGLAVVAAAIVWFAAMDRDPGEDVETMAPPVTEPVPELPPAEPLPARALRVTMEFQGTSWVDVYADGDRTVSELRVQGESLTVAADEEVRLTLSSVAVTTIEVNGEPFEHGTGDDEEIVISVPRQDPTP
ncbi:MAG: helix-turn-helix domain-containing protein [Holophagales bacterium]|nr:helix-turn-helix domain-containing protein [Holophagales bacterium]MYH24557.1 helix-turn-helix domain-containing protein [Holophagales bacterium]